MKAPFCQRVVFIALLLLFVLYAGTFIVRNSFVVEKEWFFTLFDDEMISMRYAQNLANGHGLVWNPGGDRVEGYTNFLWVLYMALFHLLPVPQSKVSLCICISGFLFLLCNLIVVKKIADRLPGSSGISSLCAVFLTGFYLPLNYFSLTGVEVSFLTLLLSYTVLRALYCLAQKSFSPVPYLLLGVGLLVRMDMTIPYIMLLSFLMIFDPKNRHQHLLYGGLILSFLLLAVTLFRFIYFGELLPNTYYLKMTGYPVFFRMTRGIFVLLVFIIYMGLLPFWVPFIYAWLRQERSVLLLLSIFCGQLLYSVYVGGDAWETGFSNRFISIGMPLFFLLFSLGVAKSFEKSKKAFVRNHRVELNVAAILIGFFCFNTIKGPGPFDGLLLDRNTLYFDKFERIARLGLTLKRITEPEATVAVAWAGTIPYFSGRNSVDLLGRNDKKIARQAMRPNDNLPKLIGFYPGHMKWDFDYSIRQLQPDIVATGWADIENYLKPDYVRSSLEGETVYFRIKSSKTR